jgi:LacI family transcriptional regulator
MVDVAVLAGVSLMTVSRVVNGTGRVGEPTRRKVDRAIEALRYTPNREARKLAGSEPIRVGFLYSGHFASDLGQFLIGLSSQANLDHVQVLVERCECAEDEGARLRRLLALRLDGIIVTPLADNDGAFALIRAAGVPAVAVDCGRVGGRVGTVDIDGHAAARLMTRHLIALGHRRIGFVTGSPDEAVSTRRLAGYLIALDEMGVSRDDTLVVSGKSSYRCGLDAAEHLLGLDERPTAVFAGNDNTAAAIVAAAHRFGLDVPSDLTVTGFGDTAVATAIWPELTTIRPPVDQMARAAVDSVARRVRALRQGCKHKPEHLCLEFELVRRQSDAAPRIRPQACLYTMPGGGARR